MQNGTDDSCYINSTYFFLELIALYNITELDNGNTCFVPYFYQLITLFIGRSIIVGEYGHGRMDPQTSTMVM